MGVLEQEGIEMTYEEGARSTASPFHTLAHEIGHAAFASERGASEYLEVADENLTQREEDIVRDEVSTYAAENVDEFVAEVYAMKVVNDERTDEVSETVQSIYEKYGGPEP